MAAKLKKGDTVIVLSGADKGKTGEVLKVFPSKGKALVRGINTRIKHSKPKSGGESGSKHKVEVPLYLSNLSYFDLQSSKSGRIGFRYENDKKVRYLKSTRNTIDVC